MPDTRHMQCMEGVDVTGSVNNDKDPTFWSELFLSILPALV